MYIIKIKQMQASITFFKNSNCIYKTYKIIYQYKYSFTVKYTEMYLLSPCRSQRRDHQGDMPPPKNCRTSDSNGPSATVNKGNLV